VFDTTGSALGTPALRRIEGELPLSALLQKVAVRKDPPGPRAGRLAARPRLVLSRRPRHNFRTNLEHPPQRHVRKKLVSLYRDNRLRLEWIALGFTEKCFWTVRWRWIIELESRVRFRVQRLNFAQLD
jgi:hypothetical protein